MFSSFFAAFSLRFLGVLHTSPEALRGRHGSHGFVSLRQHLAATAPGRLGGGWGEGGKRAESLWVFFYGFLWFVLWFSSFFLWLSRFSYGFLGFSMFLGFSLGVLF